jgi:hypothetical protein
MKNNQIRVYKTLPTAADVHNNTPLTMFSEAYMQDEGGFIASRAFPGIPVQHQSDLYYKWTRADFNRDDARVRAPGTRPVRGGARLSTGSYSALVYEWSTDIPDELRGNSDPAVNLDRNKTGYVMQTLLIRRERQFASKFLTTGVWTTDMVGAASVSSGHTVYWSTSTSKPIQDIETGKLTIQLATGKKPNTLVLGKQVRSALNYHPDLIARVNAGQTPNGPATVTDDWLKQIFGVDNLLVSEAIYNTANEGQAESNAFIAGANALLCYSDPSPSLDSATAGMVFNWTGFPGASGAGTLVRTMRDDLAFTDIVVGFSSFDMKLVAADLGYFFSVIVQ